MIGPSALHCPTCGDQLHFKASLLVSSPGTVRVAIALLPIDWLRHRRCFARPLGPGLPVGRAA